MELTWPLEKLPVVYYPPIPQLPSAFFHFFLFFFSFWPQSQQAWTENNSHLGAQITIRIPQLIELYRMPILVSTLFLPFRGIRVEH